MKHAIDKSYGKKGEAIVNMNYAAVDAGGKEGNLIKVTVPAEWKNLPDDEIKHDENRPEFIRNIVDVMHRKGMTCLSAHSTVMKTVLSLPEPLNLKNAELL